MENSSPYIYIKNKGEKGMAFVYSVICYNSSAETHLLALKKRKEKKNIPFNFSSNTAATKTALQTFKRRK